MRYVIEARRVEATRPEHERWAVMWSAPAATEDGGDGVSEEFAVATWEGFTEHRSVLEYRLARRTTVTCDQVLKEGEGDHGA